MKEFVGSDYALPIGIYKEFAYLCPENITRTNTVVAQGYYTTIKIQPKYSLAF